MNYRDCYEEGRRILAEAGIEDARLDARLLLEYVCGTDRNVLLVHGDREVSGEQYSRFRELTDRRAAHIPLQHLTGMQEFMGLEFLVNEHVLIPRQDTEILVEEVLKELQDGMSVLDLCTGSGCILLSLMHYSNGCQGVGCDISAEALETARENARRLCTIPAGEALMTEHLGEWFAAREELSGEARIVFLQSDLFEKIAGSFDIIVSNPPYIRTEVLASLMPEVREHEPRRALDGGEDGLYFYRRITEESRSFLKRGGRLYFEIGYDQAESVTSLLRKAGYVEIEIVKDFAGLDRVVFGTFPG